MANVSSCMKATGDHPFPSSLELFAEFRALQLSRRTQVLIFCWSSARSLSQITQATFNSCHVDPFFFEPEIVIKFFSGFKMLYYARLLYLFASSQKKFSAFKGSCDQIGPTQTIQDNLPILMSTSIITFEKFFLPCNISY